MRSVVPRRRSGAIDSGRGTRCRRSPATLAWLPGEQAGPRPRARRGKVLQVVDHPAHGQPVAEPGHRVAFRNPRNAAPSVSRDPLIDIQEQNPTRTQHPSAVEQHLTIRRVIPNTPTPRHPHQHPHQRTRRQQPPRPIIRPVIQSHHHIRQPRHRRQEPGQIPSHHEPEPARPARPIAVIARLWPRRRGRPPRAGAPAPRDQAVRERARRALAAPSSAGRRTAAFGPGRARAPSSMPSFRVGAGVLAGPRGDPCCRVRTQAAHADVVLTKRCRGIVTGTGLKWSRASGSSSPGAQANTGRPR